MRRLRFYLMQVFLLAAAFSSIAASGRVLKVLPQYLDHEGKHTLYPSLFERDAYQAYLREHTNAVSGMRFAVQWRASGSAAVPLLLRIEVRGSAKGDLPSQVRLEQRIEPGGWLSHWVYLPLAGEDFQKAGRVAAWRATLWEGDHLLSEQQSFLW